MAQEFIELHGDRAYSDDPAIKGRAEIIISKQRNGPIGKFELAFLHNSTRFDNLAEGYSQSGE